MNDYHKRKLKIYVARLLSFLPDSLILKIQYKLKTGHKLNLNNPERYTEKLQWYKLHYKNLVLKQCVDKYDVRKFVSAKGLGFILNECYGVFNDCKSIDFDSLPDKFICKDTLGSGSNSVLVVDKNKDSLNSIVKILQKWLNEKQFGKHPGREWPYDGQKHRVIIEKYLEQNNSDLADYKFFCFNGLVECFYVRTDYAKTHTGGKMAFFNRKKDCLKGVELDYCKGSTDIPILPPEIDTMIYYAEQLSSEFPHVRVDFYDVDGQIIFGELTFYNASGYMNFTPDEFDYILGEKFKLDGRDTNANFM